MHLISSLMMINLENPYFHQQLSLGIIYLSPIVALVLVYFKPSTYGKLFNSKQNMFGPLLSAKWCWIIFESPNWIWVVVCTWRYRSVLFQLPFSNLLLLLWFFCHYVHRSILYPLTMASTSKFPIGIVATALPYCVINGYLQTYGLLLFQEFPAKHEYTLSFVFGLILILFGFTLGYVSDRHLVRLRRTGRYLIPQGGMFDYVSCPHYLGELIEWFGFCIAANGSLATFSFAIWTCANLIPRALAQKDWYQQKFKSDYPPDRKAIFPGIL